MSQGLMNTTAIFIVLIMIVSTMIYNYTIFAEHLGVDNDGLVWSRMRLHLAGRLHKGS
jgi:hypothetical protein